MATAPSWITTPNLGVYSETYSFNVNPIVVEYTAIEPASVAQINGALPNGLSWAVVNSNVEVYGESSEIFASVHAAVTWRITDFYGVISDRTYYIGINPALIAPDWSGQRQNLGYAASGNVSTYTVTAHTTSDMPIVYSISQFTPPTGISINSSNGQITYSAPVVTAEQTTSFPVRATTDSVYSDLTVSIAVLTVPHAPAWYTASGLIDIVLEGSFVEIDLVAYDSSGDSIIYAVVSSTPSFPFTLTATGLIYGPTPTLYRTTVYQFTVSATSINGSTSRTFDIIASPVTIGALLHWNSSADLGSIADGQYVTLDCSAVSIRNTVNHSIVGGILPRGLILNRQSGLITGYAEYQTRDRSYLFDISAADTVQTITRTFVLTITRSTQYQYMGVTIPVEGSLKDLYYSYIGNTINSTWVPNASTTPQSVLYTPSVQLIQGLNYAINDPAAAVYFANLHLNTTELMIGAATNVNVSPTTTLFYSPILDANAGAAYQYAQSDNTTVSAAGTVTVQTGTARVLLSLSGPSWVANIVPGTTVRLVSVGAPNIWVQGTVANYDKMLLTISINVTMTSGSGTYTDWLLQLAPTYPPSLTNMRADLISALGWVNGGQGVNGGLLPLVDPTTGAVLGAQIVNQGSGYLYGPGITAAGAGNGAVLAANLTVISVSVHTGGNSWVVGDTVQLDQPAVQPAQLTITAVDAQGGITGISIADGGEYASFPAGNQIITNGAGLPASINLSLGLGNVWVAHGGSNYVPGGTTLTTTGYEVLPNWQSNWQPWLNMGTVFTEYVSLVVGNETSDVTSPLYYQRWPLQHVILELQGINWIGDTTFDQVSTSFDGGSTFWGEWLEPRDTVFDQDVTIFDQTNARFDDDYPVWQGSAYYAWGSTLFDQEFTIFDLYSTVFDNGPTPTHSITLLRRLLRITTQEITGHNVLV
jgi:hypothetical protein